MALFDRGAYICVRKQSPPDSPHKCLFAPVQANDAQFKEELAKVVGTEIWDAAKAAASAELKVPPSRHIDILATKFTLRMGFPTFS